MHELQKWFLAFAPFTLATFKHCLNFDKLTIIAERRISTICIYTKIPMQADLQVQVSGKLVPLCS